MWLVGASKMDITPFIEGIGLMGWGIWGNRVKEIHSKLYARAFFFQDISSGNTAVYICAEISFISLAIRQKVISVILENHAYLNLNEHNIMLTATHTHSCPGGFSHYSLYNITIPGFSTQVFETYTNGIVAAIVDAYSNRTKSNIYFDKLVIPPDQKVAFNRSLKAYNRNEDVANLSKKDWNIAIDRTMKMLRVDAINGRNIGNINWFSVHANTVHSDGHWISSDNKGYAASQMEEWLDVKNEGIVAAFAQSAAGDVSPNYKKHKNENFHRGKYLNDFRNVINNGAIQFKYAKLLFEKTLMTAKINNRIDSITEYIDLSCITSDQEFVKDTVAKTGLPVLGMSFLISTDDTKGLPKWMFKIFKKWSKIVYQKDIKSDRSIQGNKLPFIELAKNTVMGKSNLAQINIPEWLDPTIKPFKKQAAIGAFSKYPMVPSIVPIQILVIGDIAMLGTPCEFTTIAGKRLIDTVKPILEKINIKEIFIAGYANAYAGYCVTPEEYEEHHYEADSTYFGQWTLAAFQSEFKKLARMLLNNPAERRSNNLKAVEFDEKYLSNYAFEKLKIL